MGGGARGARMACALVVVLVAAGLLRVTVAAGVPPTARETTACTTAKAKAERAAVVVTKAQRKVRKAQKALRKARSTGRAQQVRASRQKVTRAKKRLRAARTTRAAARTQASAACATAPQPKPPGPPPTNPPVDPGVELPESVTVVLVQGSTTVVDLGVGSHAFEVEEVTGAPTGVSTVGAEVGLEVTAAMSAAPGRDTYRVSVELCAGGGCRADDVQVDLTVSGLAGADPGGDLGDVTLPSPDRVAAAGTIAETDALALPDEVLLTLREGLTPQQASTRASVIAAARGAVVTGGYADIAVFELRWPAPVDVTEEIRALSEIVDVDGASPTVVGTVDTQAVDAAAAGALTPREWSTATGRAAGWHLRAANVPEAWRVTTGAPDQYVGIVDNGLPPSSSELSTRSLTAPGTGTQRGKYDHPNHVSGIACAAENGRGVVGVAWGCPLVNAALKESENSATFWKSVLAAAMKIVTDTPTQVVNMSLGINSSSCATPETNEHILDLRIASAPYFRALFTRGRGAEVVWTLSAGNNCATAPSSPMGLFSGLDNVITVASSNEDGRLSRFSNFGTGVEVAAPGGVSDEGRGVLSVSADDPQWCEADRQGSLCFGYKSGTSMAAPVVAGIANLMLSANDALTSGQVGRCITGTASVGVPSRSDQQDDLYRPHAAMDYVAHSLRLVDAAAAVDCAVALRDPDPGPSPVGACGAASGLPMAECDALVDLRDASPDVAPFWTGEAPCGWRGVTCSDGHVERLELWSQSLRSLPSSIGDLTRLRALMMNGGRLTSVPASIGNLALLEDLFLEGNQLAGLPATVGMLSELRHLRLNNNQLTAVPLVIRELDGLQKLHLGNNQLSSVPAWLGNLTALNELDLQHNRLTALPPELPRLTRLQSLTVNDNRLTSLPTWIGSFAQLQHLWVYGNRLTTLPAAVGDLGNLTYLMAHDNQLRGDISGWASPLSRTGRMYSLTLAGNGCLTTGGDAGLAAWLTDLGSGWKSGC